MTTSKKRKEVRAERKLRNKQKEEEYKESARKSGKLIKENHNLNPYSRDYSVELSQCLVNYVTDAAKYYYYTHGYCELSKEKFEKKIRDYRTAIRDLLIFWNPYVSRSSSNYTFLKRLIEIYWDKDECLLMFVIKAQKL